MRKTLLSVVLCTNYFFVGAQNIRYPVTAVYTQLHAYSFSTDDPFAFINNQASLAGFKKLSVGLYGERRFLLADLAFYSAAFVLPTATGNFGLTANRFGSIDYNESSIGIAYGRKLANNIDVGTQINYFVNKANIYGSTSAINFELGAIFHISDQLGFGVHIYNPTESRIGKLKEERLPLIYSMGMGYNASENVFLGGELEKIENEPVNFKAGLQYQFDKKLFARCGVATATASFYFGLGVVLKEVEVDATASIHPYLGITPGLMLIFKGSSLH